jgi:GDP-D-mannose dehydratase
MNGHGAAGAALITGVTGQDGFPLSELLPRNGFNVHGFVRPGPTFDFIHIVEAMVTSDMQQEQQTCP